ncbi:MAG TPA: SPOR domain-containing protein [Casimicrobiaceae bacterium]|jgi:cell division protein FtsN
MAAGVAFYLARSGLSAPLAPTGAARDAGRGGKSDAVASTGQDKSDKPRFDFYKILPGGEEPKAPDRRGIDKLERPADKPAPAPVAKAPEKEAAKEAPKETPKAADRFWLQAGAFNGEADAENLKARLALSGWEAVVQTVPLPDKSVRYRVRMGPYDNTDELNRIKGELGKGGFDVAVIRNP